MLAQANAVAASEAANWLSILQNPWIYGGLLVAALVIATVVGNLLARGSRMEDSGWRFAVVIGSILVALLVLGSKWPPRFGVDLKGGTVIVGQVDTDKIDSGEVEGGSFRMEELIRQLKNRIDPTGLSEIVIRSQGTDKIEVVIPDVEAVEAERIWNKMTKIGFLQFRMVATDLGSEGVRAKELAAKQADSPDATVRRARVVMEPPSADDPAKPIATWYDLGRIEMTAAGAAAGETPAYRMLPLPSALVRDGATGRIVLPALYSRAANGEELKLLAEAQGINQLQILLLDPLEDRFRVDGEHVRSTRVGSKGFEPIVEFSMTAAGASNMYRFTDYYRPQGQAKHFMAVVLDGNVMTAPAINSPIQDRGIIEGSFTRSEVEDIVSILNAGRIPVALKKDYISLDSVQSNLGEEMKQRGIYAIVVSLLLVLVFMVVYYYQWCGVIACFAMLLNILLVAASVMAVGQALTLTGLAGFVLTVGMSVDANVLIFERIREEIGKGTALRMAIRNGFDRASTTIIDANVTTLLTAVVLYVIGTEQLKSFAVILILGILASMFTAIFVSRLAFDWLERRRMIKGLGMMQILSIERFNAIRLGQYMLPISGVVLVISLVAAFYRGGEIFDYDLRGGSTVRMVMQESEATTQEVISAELKQETVKGSRGEDIQFVVSALTSDVYPNGTYFKVESTLSVPEGDQVTEFRDLKQILRDRFGDKLLRLEVEASVVREVSESKDEGSDATAVPATSQGSSRPWPAASAPVYTSLRTDSFQDEATGDAPPAQEQATESAADPATGATQETVEEQAEAVEAEAANQETDLTDQAAPALPPTGLPPLPQVPTQEPTTETAAPAAQSVLGEFDLSFKIPVATDTVLGQLIAVAEELDLGIAEESFVVTSTTGLARDQKFQVQVRAASLADIQSIVDKMTLKLSTEPFFPAASSFGSQVAGLAQLQAMGALLASLVGIVLYVWFRFQHIWFGLAAVAALVHDVIVVLGFIALSHWVYTFLGGILLIDNFKISLSVVAALLTVVGYSLNDTIVIFDRIREVRGRSQKFTGDMIDLAVGQTMGRTILTSLTTFIVVFILFGWGGDSIHAFAFSLVIGVVAGTYSTIFVASPILLYLMKYKFIELDPVVEAGAAEA
jgi:SecD/SecF fusion protein